MPLIIIRFSLKAFLVLEKKILSVFTIHEYGHSGYLVQWHGTIKTHFQYPFDRRPSVKSGTNCSCSFIEDI